MLIQSINIKHCVVVRGATDSAAMSARLSPAASLLRTSKLFSIPPTIALPPAPASAEQIASSETATSIYPQHAAIKTTLTSHNYGDWGFKRPLPHKATKATNNPVVRLVNGIDTREQIADFESAADHVLTRRKFEELNMPLQHMPADRRDFAGTSRPAFGIENGKHLGVFRPTHDNTVNLSTGTSPAYARPSGVWPDIGAEDVVNSLPPAIKTKHIQIEETRRQQKEEEEAATAASKSIESNSGAAELELMLAPSQPEKMVEQKRWRYRGPSLAQISGQEFEEYLRKVKNPEIQEKLVRKVMERIAAEEKRRALEEGRQDELVEGREISPEQLRDYMRYLRKTPRVFGPIIAELLDLPEAMIDTETSRRRDVWEYGRKTLASEQWSASGVPRTHPSAGLSYVHSSQHVTNDPQYGPQRERDSTVARAVRSRVAQDRPVLGVAGFIVPEPQGSVSHRDKLTFEPKQGGIKVALRPTVAYIQSDAKLKMHTEHVTHVIDENEKAITSAESQRRRTVEELKQVAPSKPMPRLSSDLEQPTRMPVSRPVAQRTNNARPSPEIEDMLRS